MQKWDYTTLKMDGDDLSQDGRTIASGKNWKLIDLIRPLGDQGWELVAVVSDSVSTGGYLSEKWGPVRLFFKRPK